MLHLKAFCAALIVGSLLIVFVGPKFATFGAIFIMVVYGIYLWKRNIISEQTADSYYFLGFIFTLVALVSALRSVFSDGEVSDVIKVGGIFAIALTTTIVGLIGRIILSSAREPVDSAMRSIRQFG